MDCYGVFVFSGKDIIVAPTPNCQKCVHWDRPKGFEDAVSVRRTLSFRCQPKPVPVGECTLNKIILSADFGEKCKDYHRGSLIT